ncbi:MAG TPA: hypothetical protein VEF04_03585 [Blastocatellia bacterium]|nr:hypothetical protein [Blastocatellia bacterium]
MGLFDFAKKIAGPVGATFGGVPGLMLGNKIGGAGGDSMPVYGGRPEFKPGAATAGITAPTLNLGTKYTAKSNAGPLPEFEAIRNDARNAASGQKSTAMNALERRFAAMGNLNSGAYVKQMQNLDDRYNQDAYKSMNEINFQEAQQRRAMQDKESDREFQSGEAFNNRQFQAGQNEFDNQTKLRSLDLALHNANMESADSKFNAEMALYQAKKSGGLFGSGGFLGLGI